MKRQLMLWSFIASKQRDRECQVLVLYTGSVWHNKLTGKTYPEPVTETFNEGPWLIQPFDPELFENN